jgi:hypothetical protein
LGHQKGALLGQTPALPTNIRLGCKGLPGSSTLAYHENQYITGVKSFIILAPDVISDMNFCPNYISFFIWVKNTLFFTVLIFMIILLSATNVIKQYNNLTKVYKASKNKFCSFK